jgi:hypothetical protein
MTRKKDENQTAYDALQELIRRDAERDGVPQSPPPEPEKDASRVEAGRKGGLKGGKSRANNLTPEQRKKIARKAAKERWRKSGQDDN